MPSVKLGTLLEIFMKRNQKKIRFGHEACICQSSQCCVFVRLHSRSQTSAMCSPDVGLYFSHVTKVINQKIHSQMFTPQWDTDIREELSTWTCSVQSSLRGVSSIITKTPNLW